VATDGRDLLLRRRPVPRSTGHAALNKPVVAWPRNASGQGYWLVASDGGIFSFGDAVFHGSTGAWSSTGPSSAMASDSTGLGYWLMASDGGIFSFGDAPFSDQRRRGRETLRTVLQPQPYPQRSMTGCGNPWTLPGSDHAD